MSVSHDLLTVSTQVLLPTLKEIAAPLFSPYSVIASLKQNIVATSADTYILTLHVQSLLVSHVAVTTEQ